MQDSLLWMFILFSMAGYSFLFKLKAREGGCFLMAVVEVLEITEGNVMKLLASKHILLLYFIEHIHLSLDMSIYLYLLLHR